MRTKAYSSNAMQQIGGLFAVYQTRLRPPQKSVEKVAAAVISDVTGMVVTPNDVQFTPNTRVLAIKLRSVIKAEVLLQSDEIISRLKSELGPDRAPTIIL